MPLPPIPEVPWLDARIVGRELKGGASKPVNMYCVSVGSADETEYVVKFYNEIQDGRGGLAKELFGALLGRGLGLSIPDVAKVNITQRLARSEPRTTVAQRMRRSLGLNFGSRTLGPDYKTPVKPIRLSRQSLPAASRVFAFDMLTQIADRSGEKPNLLVHGDTMFIFDHEKAFPYANPEFFVEPLGEPWDLGSFRPLVESHIFFRELKGRGHLDFGDFFTDLGRIDTNYLDRIEMEIPSEWNGEADVEEELDNIKAHVLKAAQNSARFERAVLEVLA